MRIEEGKFYRDANGVKQGPLLKYGNSDDYGWSVPDLISVWWSKDGKAQPGKNCVNLVAEWAEDGPVRTVTRQEIIPGTYDGVDVQPLPGRNVRVSLEAVYNSDGLTRAAAVLTALAGALRDGN